MILNTAWVTGILLNNMRLFVSYLFVALLFSACSKQSAGDCFKSSGSETTEIRYPGTFNEIELYANMELTIIKSAECKIEFTGGKNVLKNLSGKVTGSVLSLENLNKCNFVRGYKKKLKANIYLPYLKNLINYGVANIHFDEGFSQDSIKLAAESSGDIYLNGNYDYIHAISNGNGDLYMKGSCKSFYLYSNGTNFVWAQNMLLSNDAFVETHTLGDCYINASQLKKFEYSVVKSGNIYYSGHPAYLINSSPADAKGKAIQKD